MITDTDWMEGALCTQSDPEAFFPEKGAAPPDAARRICKSCDARIKCLEYALTATPVVEGIWAATTERERRKLRKKMAA